MDRDGLYSPDGGSSVKTGIYMRKNRKIKNMSISNSILFIRIYFLLTTNLPVYILYIPYI